MALRRPVITIVAALVLALALYVGARGVTPVPPLGPLLDPANGVWAVAASAELPRTASARLPGLGAGVEVRYDDRGVPHIFASSEEDAYRALGYVVARDRLFQLEIQTRAASGRLTELVGRVALGVDRATRALGLPRAAERKAAALLHPAAGSPPSAGARAVLAYADGVNAWIDQMGARDLPIEYRLLGRRPMRWEPINTAHLLNRMGWTLAYSEDELTHLQAEALVGRAAADALFPVNSPIQEPIQPSGRSTPRMDFHRLPPPGEPDSAAMVVLRVAEAVGTGNGEPGTGEQNSSSQFPVPSSHDGIDVGSNNWAVAPQRTKAGRALLAGDPHLDLTLPSIWYEAHLVVPGRLDVYGVTIPGAPSIILGFNRDVAWTFTNTGADVMDYYVETVDDTLRPTRYRLDGAWRPLEMRVERYRGQRGEVIATDTLRFTHRGPLRRLGPQAGTPRWVSTRWTVLEPSNEADNTIAAARARSVAEWMQAMATYQVPAQNMLVADRAGTIAIRSTGRFPVRPGDGRGDELRDGSTSASDWRGAWPVAEYPQATRPAQGYLASANQQPVDPAVAPRYLGAGWPTPWRAMRINALLRADSAVTPDEMRRFQTDPGSARADLFVPAFLAAAGALTNQGRARDSTVARAAALLAQWDRRYTRDDQRAVLFEAAMRELSLALWDELREPGGGGERAPVPSDVVTAELLADSASAWWDDRRTPGVTERRDDILRRSLAAALRAVTREYGAPDAGGWRWSRIRHANIHHLLRLDAFSALDIPVQGGPGTLSPSSGSGTHGASWRMVVELGPELRAWGTYPGGQSGNPASRRYADRLPKWTAGELDSLRVPRRAEELGGRVTATLTLTPARGRP